MEYLYIFFRFTYPIRERLPFYFNAAWICCPFFFFFPILYFQPLLLLIHDQITVRLSLILSSFMLLLILNWAIGALVLSLFRYQSRLFWSDRILVLCPHTIPSFSHNKHFFYSLHRSHFNDCYITLWYPIYLLIAIPFGISYFFIFGSSAALPTPNPHSTDSELFYLPLETV